MFGERVSIARVERHELSDHSPAWDVLYQDFSGTVRIGCVSHKAATELAGMLNSSAWIEIKPQFSASSSPLEK